MISFAGFISLLSLFWLFFKIGLIFFGGGNVLIPVIQKELVSNLHILTQKEFIDGVAISQMTPGPIAVIATFAGYKIAGVFGALISTFAMFLPGMGLMIFLSKNYKKIKNSSTARKILNTLLPVIIGLLLATCIILAKSGIHNVYEVIAIIITFVLLTKYKINPALLIVLSAFLGLFFYS